uniref:TAFA chemokine like family member 5, like n=1 Tax=Poecilia reticulata TaxID=8081 RepID=A0A3P9P3M3_POERE
MCIIILYLLLLIIIKLIYKIYCYFSGLNSVFCMHLDRSHILIPVFTTGLRGHTFNNYQKNYLMCTVPRRTIARQTARCACRRGQIAGTIRARPACVDARVVRSRQWCEMAPCMEGEVCSLLFNRSGWTCTRGSGRIKTVTVIHTT